MKLITKKISYLLFKTIAPNSNLYHIRTWNDNSSLFKWARGYQNEDGEVILIGGEYTTLQENKLEAEYQKTKNEK